MLGLKINHVSKGPMMISINTQSIVKKHMLNDRHYEHILNTPSARNTFINISRVSNGVLCCWSISVDNDTVYKVHYTWTCLYCNLSSLYCTMAACNNQYIFIIISRVTVVLNSLWPGDAIWRHRCGSWFIQVMVCRLFGAKSLSEPTGIFVS